MGGGIALNYTLKYPHKVKGLILISSEGVPNSTEGYDASLFSDEKTILPTDPNYNKLSKTELFFSKFIGPSVIKSTLNKLIANKKLLTPQFISRFAKIIRYKGNREANILMFRQWKTLNDDPRDLEPQLHEIQVPVLYMHGEEDNLVPIEVANIFCAKLPKCKLKIYKNTGHMTMIEKPNQTAQDTINFIKGIY